LFLHNLSYNGELSHGTSLVFLFVTAIVCVFCSAEDEFVEPPDELRIDDDDVEVTTVLKHKIIFHVIYPIGF